MNKKAIGLVPVILGLIVIILVITGPVRVGYTAVKEKFFGEEGFFGDVIPSGEEEFVPYAGPPMTPEERTVLNSVNALRCALNSVAVGEFKSDDPDVCPPPLEKLEALKQAPGTPTGAFAWKYVTGSAVGGTKSYDTAEVYCEGMENKKYKLPSDWRGSMYEIMQAVVQCKNSAFDANLPQDTRCSYLDFSDWPSGGLNIEENDILSYLKANRAYDPEAIDDIRGVGMRDVQNFDIETKTKILLDNPDDAFCVDFRRGTFKNYISINDCDFEGISRSFTCGVRNFELPQPEVQDQGFATLFIQAYGDPRWLVYYESFPEDAAEYWHKEWSDVWNVWSIGMVTASGMLNVFGGLGKGVAAVRKVAQKETANLLKEGAEKLVTEGVKGISEQVLLKRVGKAGVENMLKSVVVEESLLGIKGVTPQIAREISEELIESIGPRVGTRAWKKALKKGLEEKVDDVLAKNIKNAPDDFIRKMFPDKIIVEPADMASAAQAYRTSIKKFVLEGKELPEEMLEEGASRTMRIAGKEITGGAKELMETGLEKELARGLLRKQAYQKWLSDFVMPDGKTINKALLQNNAEAALKNLDAIAKINPTAARTAWQGTRTAIDELAAGTFGGFKIKDFKQLYKPTKLFEFIQAQSPVKLSARGYVIGGTAVKTVAGLPAWAVRHRYATLLLISWFIASMDAADEKIRPVGHNSIAINQPTLLGPTVPLALNDAAGEYYIHNHIKKVISKYWMANLYGQRMYFVSPCKANLKVYLRTCTCYQNPRSHKFAYPTGMVNVEPGSVRPLSHPVLEKRFREQWLELDAKEKAIYKNDIDDWFDSQFKFYDGVFSDFIVAPKEAAGSVELSQKSMAKMYAETFDGSKAIKHCDQVDYIKDTMTVAQKVWYGYKAGMLGYDDKETRESIRQITLKDVQFKPDCLEIEPEKIDGYCYADFPETAWLRLGVNVVALVVDGVIVAAMAGTGGLAAPIGIPLLALTGVVSAGIDVGLESWEKWP